MGNVLQPAAIRRFGVASYPYPLPDSPAKRLTIFLDGIQSSGVRPGKQVLEVILRYGDFIQVRYPSQWGFSSDKIVDTLLRVVEYDTSYEVVTIMGFSMGGLVAVEVASAIECMRPNVRVELMPMDAPTRVSDLYQDAATRFARLIPAVHTPTWLNRRVFQPKEPAPREDNLSKDASDDLATHEALSLEFPFGIFARQAAYIARTRLPSKVTPPTFLIQSIDDPIVRPDISRNWGRVCDSFAHERVDSPGHGLMLEFPTLWSAAVDNGYQWFNALSLAA